MTDQQKAYFFEEDEDSLVEYTVSDVLKQAAEKYGERIALSEVGSDRSISKTWSYSKIYDDVLELAYSLSEKFSKGERVGLWGGNSADWIVFMLAGSLAGIVIVPINPAYKARELKYILGQARASGLCFSDMYRGQSLRPILEQVKSDLPNLREVIQIDDWSDMSSCRRGNMALSLPHVLTDDCVQIQYTSGTTGLPKGVLLGHRGIVNNAIASAQLVGLNGNDRVLLMMPLFHASACGSILLGCLAGGTEILLVREFEAARINALVETYAVSIIFAVPMMLGMMLESFRKAPLNFETVRLIACGGSMVVPELAHKVATTWGSKFVIVYGQTEASPMISQTDREEKNVAVYETLGRPLPNLEVSIQDAERGGLLSIGETGEICVRGYSVMQGYYDDPAGTRTAIDAEGWLHTGDLGDMDQWGNLRLSGRLKEMIIRGGENVFPVEIEDVIRQHASVVEVAVIGAPDHRVGEKIVAFVQLGAGTAFDKAVLEAHCRREMASFKVPADWVVVEAWPLSGIGKIMKYVLRDQFVAGEGSIMSLSE